MRFDEAWGVTVPLLLLAAAGACSRQPTIRQYGTVQIPLTGADAAGSPQRLDGEFILSGVDNGVVGSASTRTAGATDVLEVQLPAGRYSLTLNDEFVVESLAPCRSGATGARMAWVNPAKPPLVDVAGGQVTRVHFDLVSADSRSRGGNTLGRRRSPGVPGRRCAIPKPSSASGVELDASMQRPSASSGIGRLAT